MVRLWPLLGDQMHKDKEEKPHPMLHGQNDSQSKKWISGAIKHPGAFHKELDVKIGKKIPEVKLEKAEHSKNPKLKKRAVLAETLKKMHKGK